MSKRETELKGNATLYPDVAGVKQDDAQRKTLNPFANANQSMQELTFAPLVMGVVLGVVFGATSLYLVLKVGLAVSASIPLAVIAITVFRALSFFGFKDTTILENNIVQTAGSAGESIAFGIGVTMPAIMILGYDLEMTRVLLVSVIGGLLGILMMIPFRRTRIVQQHSYLKYPEGTACAEILKAGVASGSQLSQGNVRSTFNSKDLGVSFSSPPSFKPLFAGFGIGIVYLVANRVFYAWKEVPEKVFGAPFKAGSVGAEVHPALLGVGYIIGPRIASTVAAGGVLAYLVLIPAIKFFGEGMTTVLPPGDKLISEMGTNEIRGAYILYIGVGALAASSIIRLFRSLPTIFHSLKRGVSRLHKAEEESTVPRTERDISKKVVLVGIIVLAAISMIFRSLQINFLSMLLMLFISFMFVMVSTRLTGEVGTSMLPISGMTVAALALVCLVFLVVGWTAPLYYVAALSIGSVVCVAASTGGTTSQVLKTGFLIGATPRNQQIAVLIGALVSALALGPVLIKLNELGTVYVPRVSLEKVDCAKPLTAAQVQHLSVPYEETDQYEEGDQPPVLGVYRLLNEDGAAAGNVPCVSSGEKYLVDELSGKIVYRVRRNFSVPSLDISNLPEIEQFQVPGADLEPKTYHVWQEPWSEIQGKYLVNDKGFAVYLVDPGINGIHRNRADGTAVEKYDAPKATLMSYTILGILSRRFPWGLVLLGMMVAVVMEMTGMASLPFAVGLYLPLSSSTPIFIGGIIRWLVEKRRAGVKPETADESFVETERGPGVLLASGLIAGSAMAGILIAFSLSLFTSFDKSMAEWSRKNNPFFEGPYADLLSFLLFLALGIFLYLVGREWLLSDRGRNQARDS
jgi:putative OPT family oligopeptide transporter